MMQSRTHTCGELRIGDVGKTVTLAGWLENMRVVSAGLAFVAGDRDGPGEKLQE